ncbi:ribonuclease III, partial [bacterium]
MTDAVKKARALLRERLRIILELGDAEDAQIPRLDEALTHPSFSNESGHPDNQRLEFLGDAVLGLCVSEHLIALHPEADEGLLTRMRSALVNAGALADWARKANLGECLSLGRGARAGTERDQTNVLGDAVEAVVAAIYEAYGIEGARAFVRELVREPLVGQAVLGSRDPKSALQELVQGEGRPTPSYRLAQTRGHGQDQVFEIEVLVGGEVLARGEGRSKRLAERAAANAALDAE